MTSPQATLPGKPDQMTPIRAADPTLPKHACPSVLQERPRDEPLSAVASTLPIEPLRELGRVRPRRCCDQHFGAA